MPLGGAKDEHYFSFIAHANGGKTCQGQSLTVNVIWPFSLKNCSILVENLPNYVEK